MGEVARQSSVSTAPSAGPLLPGMYSSWVLTQDETTAVAGRSGKVLSECQLLKPTPELDYSQLRKRARADCSPTARLPWNSTRPLSMAVVMCCSPRTD